MKNNLSEESSQFQERINYLKKNLTGNNKKMESSQSDDSLIDDIIYNNDYLIEIIGEKQYKKALEGRRKRKIKNFRI